MERVSLQAQALYERLRSLLEEKFLNQIVALHPDSGDYEAGPRRQRPQVALRLRHPEGGLIVTRQIGASRHDDLFTARVVAGKLAAGRPK